MATLTLRFLPRDVVVTSNLGAQLGAAVAKHAGEERAHGVAELEVEAAAHLAGDEVDGDQLVAAGGPLQGDRLGRGIQRLEVGHFEAVLGQLVGHPLAVDRQGADGGFAGARGEVQLSHGAAVHLSRQERFR